MHLLHDVAAARDDLHEILGNVGHLFRQERVDLVPLEQERLRLVSQDPGACPAVQLVLNRLTWAHGLFGTARWQKGFREFVLFMFVMTWAPVLFWLTAQ